MTSDGLSIVTTLLQQFWKMFTSWYIPGTNITPAAWFIFMLFFYIVIKFIKTFFGSDTGGN